MASRFRRGLSDQFTGRGVDNKQCLAVGGYAVVRLEGFGNKESGSGHKCVPGGIEKGSGDAARFREVG